MISARTQKSTINNIARTARAIKLVGSQYAIGLPSIVTTNRDLYSVWLPLIKISNRIKIPATLPNKNALANNTNLDFACGL